MANPFDDVRNPYADVVDWDAYAEYLAGRSTKWNTRGNNSRYNAAENASSYFAFESDLALARANAEWNSYPNQVAEMRKAGLNPDLLGVSLGNSSSSSSGGRTQTHSADSSVLDGIGAVASIASTALDSYLSYKKNMSLISNFDLRNQGLRLSNAQSENQFLMDYVIGNMSPEDIAFIQNPIGTSDDGLPSGLSLDFSAEQFAEETGLPMSVAKRFSSNWKRRISSPTGRKATYQALADYSKAKTQFDADRTSPGWSDTYVPSDSMEAKTKIAYELYMMTSNYQKDLTSLLDPSAIAGAQNAEASYNSQYFGNLDAAVAAGAENAVNAYNADYNSSLDGSSMASSAMSVSRMEQFKADMISQFKKFADALAKSGDPACKSMAYNIYSFVATGNFMKPGVFATNFAISSSAGLSNIIEAICSGDLSFLTNGPGNGSNINLDPSAYGSIPQL